MVIDCICQVLVKQKSKKLIDQVLREFIPKFTPLSPDYIGKPDDINYVFNSEEEMVSFYTDTTGVEASFYWNQQEINPHRIMVGAHILQDDQMVISLTVDTNKENQSILFNRLKQQLNSEVEIISYTDPVYCENGKIFEELYRLTLENGK